MNRVIFSFFLALIVSNTYAQRDSLQLFDRYADDQIYVSISYAQFGKQPAGITRSTISFGISTGFLKDFILIII